MNEIDKSECCNGRGWGIFTTYGSLYCPDGSLAVQKCDECETFKDDEDAAKACGLKCSQTYPCVIDIVDVPDDHLTEQGIKNKQEALTKQNNSDKVTT